MTNKIRIETERLVLREYRLSDWKTVHDHAKRGDILVFEAWGPNTETDTKHFVKTVMGEQKKTPRNNFDLAVILKKEKKLIGGCHLELKVHDQTEGYIGYIIHPDHWRSGYAYEATNAVIDHMSALSNIKIFKATCDVLNIASQKVLEKCGFKVHTKIERDFLMKGRYRDTFVYEKLISFE